MMTLVIQRTSVLGLPFSSELASFHFLHGSWIILFFGLLAEPRRHLALAFWKYCVVREWQLWNWCRDDNVEYCAYRFIDVIGFTRVVGIGVDIFVFLKKLVIIHTWIFNCLCCLKKLVTSTSPSSYDVVLATVVSNYWNIALFVEEPCHACFCGRKHLPHAFPWR